MHDLYDDVIYLQIVLAKSRGDISDSSLDYRGSIDAVGKMLGEGLQDRPELVHVISRGVLYYLYNVGEISEGELRDLLESLEEGDLSVVDLVEMMN